MALHVHLDDRIPFGFSHVHQYPVTQNAGVVDHDVQIAECFDGRVDEALATFPVGHIVAVHNGLATHCLDVGHRLLGRREIRAGAVIGTAEIVHHDLGAFRCEEQSVLAPDTSPSTRDNGNSSIQCAHESPLRSEIRPPLLQSHRPPVQRPHGLGVTTPVGC